MPYKATAGIYQIQSMNKPERSYIGSAININDRWGRHKRALRKNKHENVKLQRHYNKYGENDLAFEIIESGDYLDKNHLLSREQGWFYHFKYKNTEIPFFNMVLIAGSPLGIKRSEETKRRVGLASKGRGKGKKRAPFTKEHKKHLSESALNRPPVSLETKKKLSESQRKANKNPKIIESRRKGQLGRKHSVGTKNKIKEWNLNRPSFTEEHCKNISNALKKVNEMSPHKRNPKTGRYE